MLQELALNLKNIALVPVQTYPHSKFNLSLPEPHGKTHKKTVCKPSVHTRINVKNRSLVNYFIKTMA